MLSGRSRLPLQTPGPRLGFGLTAPTQKSALTVLGSRRKQTVHTVQIDRIGQPQTAGTSKSGEFEYTLPNTETRQEEEAFEWTKCWYPVAVVEDLEPLRPTPVKLLGRQLVIWRNGGEEEEEEEGWRCFEDLCPHRLAPLSEGRVDSSDGTIVCSYHGWKFNEQGACVKIPQAVAEAKTMRDCPRASVKSFPVQVKADLLWVWPEDSPLAFINSAAVEPPYGGYEEDDFFQMYTPYTRDIPYAMDTLVENVVDPSHVPYAHHGLQGDRNEAGWYKVKSLPVEPNTVFKVALTSMANIKELAVMAKLLFNGGNVTQFMEFQPPGVVKYSFFTDKYPDAQSYVMAISTPISADESKIFWRVLVRKSTMPKLTSFLVNVWHPKWVNHMESTAVLNGDVVLLSQQTRTIRGLQLEGREWSSNYYCATEADLAVILFRKWFHGKGKGGPLLPNGKPLLSSDIPPTSRRKLLDCYHSHTKNCKVCSGALRNIRILERMAQAAGCVFAAFWLVYMKQLSANGGVYAQAGVLLGMTASFLMAKVLNKMKQKFIYVDYEHWKT